MKVFAMTSAATDWLCEGLFLPSLLTCEPDADVTVVRLGTGGNGNFMCPEFKSIMLDRPRGGVAQLVGAEPGIT